MKRVEDLERQVDALRREEETRAVTVKEFYRAATGMVSQFFDWVEWFIGQRCFPPNRFIPC